jgi:hypothetical protein
MSMILSSQSSEGPITVAELLGEEEETEALDEAERRWNATLAKRGLN